MKTLRNLFKKNKTDEPQNITRSHDYQKWREIIFSVVGEQVGVSQPDQVYGVLMDVGLTGERWMPASSNMVISETAFASGEASLRTSFGGGVTGLGGTEEIAEQARHIVQLANGLFSTTIPAANQGWPPSGMVYFYFLTTSGIRRYESPITDIRPGHPFAEIFDRFTWIKRQADQLMEKYSSQK